MFSFPFLLHISRISQLQHQILLTSISTGINFAVVCYFEQRKKAEEKMKLKITSMQEDVDAVLQLAKDEKYLKTLKFLH